jgi:hypothetical protein
MAEQTQSRFALNLTTQFLVAFILTIVSASIRSEGASVVFSAIASIMWLTFSFGFFYGIFRAFGVRAAGLESFYQSFPFRGTFVDSPSPVKTPQVAAKPFRCREYKK